MADKNIDLWFHSLTLCAYLIDKNLKKAAELLVKRKADPNTGIPLLNGHTPFHVAVQCIDEEFAMAATKLILSYGGNPNVKAANGKTPVHIAAAWGRVEILEILLASGGDPSILSVTNNNSAECSIFSSSSSYGSGDEASDSSDNEQQHKKLSREYCKLCGVKGIKENTDTEETKIIEQYTDIEKKKLLEVYTNIEEKKIVEEYTYIEEKKIIEGYADIEEKKRIEGYTDIEEEKIIEGYTDKEEKKKIEGNTDIKEKKIIAGNADIEEKKIIEDVCQKTPIEAEEGFVCAICYKSFPRKAYLFKHIYMHLRQKEAADVFKLPPPPATGTSNKTDDADEASIKDNVSIESLDLLRSFARSVNIILKRHVAAKTQVLTSTKATAAKQGAALRKNLLKSRVPSNYHPIYCRQL